jgi:hypothetical protein
VSSVLRIVVSQDLNSRVAEVGLGHLQYQGLGASASYMQAGQVGYEVFVHRGIVTEIDEFRAGNTRECLVSHP